jgi:fimbrial isopeptide formation D2 family protein/uncharacterized repeat protein (TIGR01451 family)
MCRSLSGSARKALLTLCFAAGMLCVPAAALATSPPCNNTIYGMDASGNIWQFTPPAPAATRVAGLTIAFGTIARGVYSGNLYDISGSTLYSYDLGTNARTTVGTFSNTSFLIASGFSQNGLGYVMSTTEAFVFPDASSSSPTRLGAPVVSSGPALTSFNGGDLAVDISGTGWIILSNASNYSYLYNVVFGPTSTVLTPVAEITLGGAPYTTADLYSLAFGADGTLYATSAGAGHLYSVNQVSGALTDLGAQGAALEDLASCPFGASTFIKTAPVQTAPGELLAYVITVTNSSTTAAATYAFSDPITAGLAVTAAVCSPAADCSSINPAQTVTATITVPPSTATTLSSMTVTIYARNSTISSGTFTNRATLTNSSGTAFTVAASTQAAVNDVVKTITNTTTGQTGSSVTSKPGDTLTYAITYSNLTNTAIASYAISDVMPANVTYVAGSAKCLTVPTGTTCTPPAGPFTPGSTLTWSLTGSFANGQKVVVQFQAKVN